MNATLPTRFDPAVPINLLSYGAQSMAMSYSFTFQLCAMTWGGYRELIKWGRGV